MSEFITSEVTEHFVKITFDDGKVNAMSHSLLRGLHDAFDAAAAHKKSVVLSGRPGIFSAGFDLNVLRGDSAVDRHILLRLGAELALKILTFPCDCSLYGPCTANGRVPDARI